MTANYAIPVFVDVRDLTLASEDLKCVLSRMWNQRDSDYNYMLLNKDTTGENSVKFGRVFPHCSRRQTKQIRCLHDFFK